MCGACTAASESIVGEIGKARLKRKGGKKGRRTDQSDCLLRGGGVFSV